MTNEIKRLLAVLDMTENSPEQYGWLLSTIREHKACCPADLAFRLRDKAIVNQGDIAWHKAVVGVCGYMGKETAWFKNYGQPIHWIIAALIAKELGKNDKEKKTS